MTSAMHAISNFATLSRAGSLSRAVWLLARGFWLALLVGHAWLAWRSVAGVSVGQWDVGGLLLLTLSNALFILKLLDVRWLRLPRDARGLMLVVLAFGLVHVGALDDSGAALPLQWFALVGGAAGMTTPRRDHELAAAPVCLALDAPVRSRSSLDALQADAHVLRLARCVLRLIPDRAPPTLV